MARNFRKEYDNYQGTPAQKKRRAQRNKARRLMIRKGKAKKGDVLDASPKVVEKLILRGYATTKLDETIKEEVKSLPVKPVEEKTVEEVKDECRYQSQLSSLMRLR